MRRPIFLGDNVRIKKGRAGEGYRFRVTAVGSNGEIYGPNYGPVWADDIEHVK